MSEAAASAPTIPGRRSRASARWRRSCLRAGLVLAALYCAYMVAAEVLVAVADRRVPRDPATGIALGAEERELGPPESRGGILLVHGFVGGSNNFSDLGERLAARGWRVRMMRLPGHGTSPREYARTTRDELVESVRAELAALRARHERVLVVGHSMGGALASITVSLDGADGLALAAPYYGVAHKWWYVIRPERWTRLMRPALRWLYKGELFLQVNLTESKPLIYSYDWVPMRGLVTLVEVGEEASRPELLARIECPVLLLHSEGDIAADVEASQRAFESMGAASKELVRLTRSNHHLFWDHEAEDVKEAIVRFAGEP